MASRDGTSPPARTPDAGARPDRRVQTSARQHVRPRHRRETRRRSGTWQTPGNGRPRPAAGQSARWGSSAIWATLTTLAASAPSHAGRATATQNAGTRRKHSWPAPPGSAEEFTVTVERGSPAEPPLPAHARRATCRFEADEGPILTARCLGVSSCALMTVFTRAGRIPGRAVGDRPDERTIRQRIGREALSTTTWMRAGLLQPRV